MVFWSRDTLFSHDYSFSLIMISLGKLISLHVIFETYDRLCMMSRNSGPHPLCVGKCKEFEVKR